jgi:hypothetical protein
MRAIFREVREIVGALIFLILLCTVPASVELAAASWLWVGLRALSGTCSPVSHSSQSSGLNYLSKTSTSPLTSLVHAKKNLKESEKKSDCVTTTDDNEQRPIHRSGFSISILDV